MYDGRFLDEQSYHGLFGDVHQVLDVVVLVLLKGRKQHVQHLLLLRSRSLSLLFLFPLVLALQQQKTIIKPCEGHLRISSQSSGGSHIVLVVSHGFVVVGDGFVQLLRQPDRFGGLLDL